MKFNLPVELKKPLKITKDFIIDLDYWTKSFLSEINQKLKTSIKIEKFEDKTNKIIKLKSNSFFKIVRFDVHYGELRKIEIIVEKDSEIEVDSVSFKTKKDLHIKISPSKLNEIEFENSSRKIVPGLYFNGGYSHWGDKYCGISYKRKARVCSNKKCKNNKEECKTKFCNKCGSKIDNGIVVKNGGFNVYLSGDNKFIKRTTGYSEGDALNFIKGTLQTIEIGYYKIDDNKYIIKCQFKIADKIKKFKDTDQRYEDDGLEVSDLKFVCYFNENKDELLNIGETTSLNSSKKLIKEYVTKQYE